MTDPGLANRLASFVEYCALLAGDEKGEAQVFCDRLFRAFGHAGYKEAGAVLEARVRGGGGGGGTGFADLVWKPTLLLEMKKRGTDLSLHYRQAFDYWVRAVPDRPRYVVLCNFDEFWIYDFDKQIDEPVDLVRIDQLPQRHLALAFLEPGEVQPVFGNDREAVTREAAEKLALVFQDLIEAGQDPEHAQRFLLQTVVALFGEDMDLLPRGLVVRLLDDCLAGESTFDILGGLFRQMNRPGRAPAGRYVDVPYFNGGLFRQPAAIHVLEEQVNLLRDAALEDWSRVNPVIFGTLFQASLTEGARHARGAHFTSEADILRVVRPTIVAPWEARIGNARTFRELMGVRAELLQFRVLDPACGSGNFLYVAFRELVRVEMGLLLKLRSNFSAREFRRRITTLSLISPGQFFGIDIDPFAVELAKVTLMLAKKLAIDEAMEVLSREQFDLTLQGGEALPLENLDPNFTCGDALFEEWPNVDAIIGNPPFQSKNKIQQELGRAYVNRVRKQYPDVPGRADYCVYWFRRAHDELGDGERAGLVGTNTIRQNYSREGGLDYIVNHGGTITDAVSSQVWSGDAVVHVSIVNWVKGEHEGKRLLYSQLGDLRDSPWTLRELETIPSSLSPSTDVTSAENIPANRPRTYCLQGQTPGNEAFLLSLEEANEFLRTDPSADLVLHPFLIASDFISELEPGPRRYVIDFAPRNAIQARAWPDLLDRVEQRVLPDRKAAVAAEEERNREALAEDPNASVNRHHEGFLKRWWQLSYPRRGLLKRLQGLSRYIVCGRVTRRPIFDFVDPTIRPGDSLTVFPLQDDYSFGILQSSMHWEWFVHRCSTLKGDPRYTSTTVFTTFPWPQEPSRADVEAVAASARDLVSARNSLRKENDLSLRQLYRTLEQPGVNPLRRAQAVLDGAVNRAYGFGGGDVLGFLLKLNKRVADDFDAQGPGVPTSLNIPRQALVGDYRLLPETG